MGRGTATVLTAKELVGSDATGAESYWWQDLAEHRWGKARWALELEVRPDAGQPYEVRDVYKMPNRLFRIRDSLKGTGRLRPGIVLPVEIDDRDPRRVEIDWKAFAAGGGMDQLYGEQTSIRDEVRGFVADLRKDAHADEPDVPRPTSETHPPVDGVDYDTFVRATVSFERGGDWTAHCEAHGYPVGRVDAVNAEWYRRAADDPVVSAWYTHETRRSGT